MEIEYVYEVDLEDNILQKVTHGEMREKKLRHREVLVLIIDHQDNFLVQKRSKHMDIHPGVHQSGAGGCVRAGETYEAAAHREINEELGIDNVKLNYLFDYVSESDLSKVNCRVYYAFYEGEIRIDPKEVERAMWLPIKDIPKFIEEHEYGKFNVDIFNKYYTEYFKERTHK